MPTDDVWFVVQRDHYGAILPLLDANFDTALFSSEADAIRAAKADIFADELGFSVHRYGAPE